MSIIDRTIPRSIPVRHALLSVAILFAAFACDVAAQEIDYSIANEFRYGIGEQRRGEITEGKEYLENLFNARVYVGDFTLGFRFQLDKPREYGPDTIGLTQYFAEFTRDELNVRGGTFYDLIGRGLVFNTFESRPIGFNTQTEGVDIKYRDDDFAAGAFGGVLSYPDILGSNRLEQYLIRSGWGEVSPIDAVTVGGSFLAATGQKTRVGFRNEFDAYLREGYIGVKYEGIDAYFNYADKRSQVDSATLALSSSQAYGHGWYGKLGYTGSLFGVIGEYKDYRFDLVEPGDRDIPTRETRALPFQNPPTLIPEHDKTLLARNPHNPDVSDELGLQLTGLIYPADDLTFTVIGSAGSRHQAWSPELFTDSTGEEQARFRLVEDQRLSFPSFSDIRYSPYWEIFAHADYQLNDDVSLAAAIQRKDNLVHYDGDGLAIAPHIEEYKTTTLMLEAMTKLSGRNSLHSILELQRVYDSREITSAIDTLGIEESDGRYFNTLLTLEFSRSPRWSVNTRVEVSTVKNEQEGRHVWPVVGGTYRIGRAHTIGAQYGWERGGVVCTGGVCRFINPFTGFRLTITSKL